jgi:cobalt-zinc-cadmium efflux system membrane fusion protein
MLHKSYTILLLAAIFVSCGSDKKDAVADPVEAKEGSTVITADQVKTGGIELGMPETVTMYEDLAVNGVVDVPPQNIVSISFPMGGYLQRTSLMPGMRVNKGQVIGVMEDQSLIQLQQDYLMGKAKLVYLEQDYNRQKELNESNVNAGKIFQQAEAEFNSQRVMQKANAEKLKLIGINPDKLNEQTISKRVALYSPINGYVSKVNVNIGKYVQPADVLFELINPDDIHAALTIFQKDMPKIKVGQQVTINFVDEPNKKYPGEIILVTRNLDENRSGTVHCHFETHPAHLLPGMYLQATIKVSSANAVSLPEEAVVDYLGKSYVFISSGADKFNMTEVQTGIHNNGLIQILNPDVMKGQKVVVKNAYAVLGAAKNTAEEE